MVIEKNVKQELALIAKQIQEHHMNIQFLRGVQNVLSSLTTDTIFVNAPDEVKATIIEK